MTTENATRPSWGGYKPTCSCIGCANLRAGPGQRLICLAADRLGAGSDEVPVWFALRLRRRCPEFLAHGETTAH